MGRNINKGKTSLIMTLVTYIAVVRREIVNTLTQTSKDRDSEENWGGELLLELLLFTVTPK